MSQTEYFVQGPFSVSRDDLVHGKDKLPEFWQREGPSTWAGSVGVYVFAVRTGPGKLIPYYVGQTSRSFQDEVFVARNMRKYASAVDSYEKCQACVFLVVRSTKRGRVSKRELNGLERLLITLGEKQNPHIKNVRGKTIKPSWVIQGITVPRVGRPRTEVKAFQKLMGLED